jgi:hypothetical protein
MRTVHLHDHWHCTHGVYRLSHSFLDKPSQPPFLPTHSCCHHSTRQKNILAALLLLALIAARSYVFWMPRCLRYLKRMSWVDRPRGASLIWISMGHSDSVGIGIGPAPGDVDPAADADAPLLLSG